VNQSSKQTAAKLPSEKKFPPVLGLIQPFHALVLLARGKPRFGAFKDSNRLRTDAEVSL